MLIAVLRSGDRSVRIFRLPLLRFLGMISFSLYLFHTAVAGMLYGIILHRRPALEMNSTSIVMLLSLAISILFATVSYFLIERTFLNLGRSKSYDKIPAQFAVSPLDSDVQQAA